MEKDDPSGAGARTDQSRTAGEESAPDGRLDALLAALTAASFDVERQDALRPCRRHGAGSVPKRPSPAAARPGASR